MKAACEKCVHWHKIPSPDLSVRRGQCRERLHVVTVMSQGGVGMLAGYPETPADFPACGNFLERGLFSGGDLDDDVEIAEGPPQ